MAEKDMVQFSVHSVTNLINVNQCEMDIKDSVDRFSKDYGVRIDGAIERFGIDLTGTQSRVVEALLGMFTNTSFLGNIPPKSREQYVKEEYSGKTPLSLKYVDYLPRIKITQSDLMKALGIKRNRGGDWARAISALGDISEKQYCYFYNRLALDDNGRGIKGKNGGWEKEDVYSVDTLFRILTVLNEDTGTVKYHEITPSPIFLDQRESYFVLVPSDWRSVVQRSFGGKRSSSYIFRFILYLMYEQETFRRSGGRGGAIIERSPVEVGRGIKMPESVLLRNRNRVNSILEDCYFAAKSLGYLSEYKSYENKTLLTLSMKTKKNTFSSTGDLVENPNRGVSKGVFSVFSHYHESLKMIDAKHEGPGEKEDIAQYGVFEGLVAERGERLSLEFIDWCMKKPYWASKISDPKNLRLRSAWLEFLLEKKQKSASSNHRVFAENISRDLRLKGSSVVVEVAPEHVEIRIGNREPYVISFAESNFVDLLTLKVEGCLKFVRSESLCGK